MVPRRFWLLQVKPLCDQIDRRKVFCGRRQVADRSPTDWPLIAGQLQRLQTIPTQFLVADWSPTSRRSVADRSPKSGSGTPEWLSLDPIASRQSTLLTRRFVVQCYGYQEEQNMSIKEWSNEGVNISSRIGFSVIRPMINDECSMYNLAYSLCVTVVKRYTHALIKHNLKATYRINHVICVIFFYIGLISQMNGERLCFKAIIFSVHRLHHYRYWCMSFQSGDWNGGEILLICVSLHAYILRIETLTTIDICIAQDTRYTSLEYIEHVICLSLTK